MQRWFSVLSHLNKMAGTFPWQINELIHYVINQLIEQLIDYDYFSGVCFCSCHTKFIITMKAQTHLTATYELQKNTWFINELHCRTTPYELQKNTWFINELHCRSATAAASIWNKEMNFMHSAFAIAHSNNKLLVCWHPDQRP